MGCGRQATIVVAVALIPIALILTALRLVAISFKSRLDLENSNYVWRTGHTSGNIDRFGDDKEAIPAKLFALICQPLEIKQLADWHTPSRQHYFM